MAKVRVPKELRPPERFNAFRGPENGEHGKFKVKGAYRFPRKGELFWSGYGVVERALLNFRFYERVILERVK